MRKLRSTIPTYLVTVLVALFFSAGCTLTRPHPLPSPSETSPSPLDQLFTPLLPSCSPVSPFAAYRDFWQKQSTITQESYQKARLLLYKIVAGNKLNKEQTHLADQLCMSLEHARLMHHAHSTSLEDRQHLQQALAAAIRLKQVRTLGTLLPGRAVQQRLEQSLPDPFKLEFLAAMQNAVPVKPLSWEPAVPASSQRLRLQLAAEDLPAGACALAFYGLPDDSILSVNGQQARRVSPHAKHSYRIPLPGLGSTQGRLHIDIHIPHPPQRVRLAPPWLIRMTP